MRCNTKITNNMDGDNNIISHRYAYKTRSLDGFGILVVYFSFIYYGSHKVIYKYLIQML